MNARRLSGTAIKSLKPKEKRYMRADGDGLNLEVHPSGLKVWRVRYRRDGRPAIKSIGRWPTVSPEEARKRLARMRPSLFSGIQGMTVADFSERYVREIVSRNRRNPDDITRYFERNILPVIGKKAMDAVTVADLRTIIFAKREQGRFQAALALRDILKRFFDYAVVCEVVAANPVLAVPRKLIATSQARMRALSRAEVGEFVCRLEDMQLSPYLKAALQLLILTMMRKTEVRLARWEHIDLAGREWSVPPQHTKTHMPHVVYLSRQAVLILESLAALYPDKTPDPKHLIFPNRWSRTQPISEATLNKALIRVAGDMEHFTIHDLRRTGATLLSEAEYSPDVIEKALNHTIKGVRGIYNRAQYADQRRRMLQDWADAVEDLAIEHRKTMPATSPSGHDIIPTAFKPAGLQG